MPRSGSRWSPLGRGICYCYCLVALLYTTIYVVVPAGLDVLSPFSFGIPSFAATSSGRHARVDLVAHARRVLEARRQSHAALGSDPGGSSWDFKSSQDIFYWNKDALGSQSADSGGDVEDIGLPMREETYLSKAFAHTLHPTEIVPFYYKASGTFDSDDVTITTLVTSNRYRVFKQLVERYQGPISVTIHIPLPPDHSQDLSATNEFIDAVNALDALYMSTPLFKEYVDVHLALTPLPNPSRPSSESSENGRQFNAWRNIARLFARTEFAMMLDVDFAICTDWRTMVRRGLRSTLPIFQGLRNGTVALVVPVFEYTKQEDGMDQRAFPQDKEALVRLAIGPQPSLAMFHASWAPGHNSTDYKHYLSFTPGSERVYKVTTYQSSYEPYVIMSKRVPWCDERFTGYGGNKAACLFEMYLSGVSYWVMTDHFLIHQSHKYEEEARREERKYNRKLFANFKEEACLRYLYQFYHAGLLNTPISANAIEQCTRIKSVEKLASELLNTTFTI